MAINTRIPVSRYPGLYEGNTKGKKTTSRDLISPNQPAPQKEQVKKIGTGSNDIIERAGEKVITEDGRELLK